MWEKIDGKKKVKTRYGQINVSKSHQFISSIVDSGFSPYFRELLLYSGQEDNYAKRAESLEKFLRIPVNAMQIYRQATMDAEVVRYSGSAN